MEAAEMQAAQLQTSSITSISDRDGASGVDKLTLRGRQDTTGGQGKKVCYCCGHHGHSPEKCFYKEEICNKCHIAKACKSPTAAQGTCRPSQELDNGQICARGSRSH